MSFVNEIHHTPLPIAPERGRLEAWLLLNWCLSSAHAISTMGVFLRYGE
jgi:hypothetical protein